MIIVVTAFFGAIFGAFVGVGWLSVDAILQAETMTVDRFMGCVGAGVVLSQLFWLAVVGWEEFGWHNRRPYR